MDELAESISKLNKTLQFMYRTGKPDMVNQITLAINSYKSEYIKRQQALWDKGKPNNIENKIDIT